MKEIYDEQSRNNLIKYRLQRAKETLIEAKYNADGGYYNAAINRLYYACFYASIALLLANNLETSTHKGVKSLLGLHFINTGKLESKYGSIYQLLFSNRQSGDYEDFIFCDERLFNDLYPKSEEYVEKLTRLIESGD